MEDSRVAQKVSEITLLCANLCVLCDSVVELLPDRRCHYPFGVRL